MITVNTDKTKLDIDYIHKFLTNSYWAENRTIKEVKKTIDNSLCFGAYFKGKQIGFARVVTDKVVFSYIMDVFIDPKFQGKKYGQIFFTEIYKHLDLVTVKNHYLHTKDAQEFYKKLGWEIYKTPNKHMLKSKQC
jgi:N-acetylglutamate synthase-like GNAT family acetyltransferase